jgi:hypothetical protein
MQSKALAAKVPDSMILKAYQSHSETLSKVAFTPKSIKEGLREFSREWAKGTVDNLRNRTRYPGEKAYNGIPRSQGGLRTALKPYMVYDEEKYIQPSFPRIDPVTMVLAGDPGCGKSTLQVKVSHLISKALKKKYENTVYSRNAGMKHWDGYHNQPLVIVDDFGQQRLSTAQENSNANEFITLSSSADLQLPMASMKEKGRKFNSPLLLYSTNLQSIQQFSHYLNYPLMNREAVERRVKDHYLTMKKVAKGWTFTSTSGKVIEFPSLRIGAKYIADRLLSAWEQKSKYYQDVIQEDETFEQEVYVCGERSLKLRFPVHPEEKMGNDVEAFAIPEPLKVRMITKEQPLTYALKPLQLAMLEALREVPCMKPCFTPDYDDEINDMSRSMVGQWVSGDYTAATDNLHQDVMDTILGVLVEELGEHPLANYVRWEMGVHTVHYPKWTKIEPIQQTNGQLMGSLLSFPVLCIANAFTLATAQRSESLRSVRGLIHGDDLLARMTGGQFRRWKNTARS